MTTKNEDGGVAFPVGDLLNGIYRFVSSYIKPKAKTAENKLEEFEDGKFKNVFDTMKNQ